MGSDVGRTRRRAWMEPSWTGILIVALVNILVAALAWGGLPRFPSGRAGMVRIPAGQYLAGPEKSSCTLPEFWIGAHEVTNAQFRQFVAVSAYRPQGKWTLFATPGRDDHPVVRVTWDDAVAYAHFYGWRLPTSAEWEKACRGTDGKLFPWGDHWADGAANVNTASSSAVETWTRDCSPYGVFDMAGNAMEWTASAASSLDRDTHIVRGSGWMYLEEAARGWWLTEHAGRQDSYCIGFRCAWSR